MKEKKEKKEQERDSLVTHNGVPVLSMYSADRMCTECGTTCVLYWVPETLAARGAECM